MPSRRRLLMMFAAVAAPVIGGAAFFIPKRANAYYRGPVSDHFDGERFFNPVGRTPKGLDQVARLYWMETWEKWPASLPSTFPTDKPPPRVSGAGARLSYVSVPTQSDRPAAGGSKCQGDSSTSASAEVAAARSAPPSLLVVRWRVWPASTVRERRNASSILLIRDPCLYVVLYRLEEQEPLAPRQLHFRRLAVVRHARLAHAEQSVVVRHGHLPHAIVTPPAGD